MLIHSEKIYIAKIPEKLFNIVYHQSKITMRYNCIFAQRAKLGWRDDSVVKKSVRTGSMSLDPRTHVAMPITPPLRDPSPSFDT